MTVGNLVLQPTDEHHQRIPKLRDSCANCARSKVRCSKNRPTCHRCARKGKPCQYVQSKRFGRPASSTVAPLNASRRKPERTISGTSSTSDNMLDFMTSFTAEQILGDATSLEGLTLPLPLPPGSDSGGDEQHFLGGDLDFGFEHWNSAPTSTLQPGPDETTTMSTPVDEGMDVLFAMLTDIHSLHGPEVEGFGFAEAESSVETLPESNCDHPASNSHKTVNSHADSDHQDRGCLSVALATIPQLFLPSNHRCSSTGLSEDSTLNHSDIDSIFARNKLVTETMTKILECPCSKDEYLSCIISLIALKVLSWYAAVAKHPLVNETTNDVSPITNPRHNPGNSARPTIGVRLVSAHEIGAHKLGQGRMAAQRVLGELHRVQRIVKLVRTRLAEIRHGRNDNAFSSGLDSGTRNQGKETFGAGVSTLSAMMLDEVEAELGSKLKAVSGKAIDILYHS